MLLKIFKANHFYNFILLPLVGIALLLASFLSDGIFPAENCTYTTPICLPLYNSGISYKLAIAINFTVVLIICFLLLQINAKYDFVKERTFLPTFLFLFIVYAIPYLHVIQPIFISAVFLIMAIRSVFNGFNKRDAISNGFDSGFFIGLAGIFYINVNFLVLIVPISIFILRNKLEWREFIAPIVGFIIPWGLLFSYYFIWSDVEILTKIISNSILPKEHNLINSIPLLIYFGFLVLITINASIFILKQYEMKSISTRRYFKILSVFFIASLLLMLLPSVSFEIIVILALPLTFLITNYLIFMRRRFWAELFLIILLIISILLQFVI